MIAYKDPNNESSFSSDPNSDKIGSMPSFVPHTITADEPKTMISSSSSSLIETTKFDKNQVNHHQQEYPQKYQTATGNHFSRAITTLNKCRDLKPNPQTDSCASIVSLGDSNHPGTRIVSTFTETVKDRAFTTNKSSRLPSVDQGTLIKNSIEPHQFPPTPTGVIKPTSILKPTSQSLYAGTGKRKNQSIKDFVTRSRPTKTRLSLKASSLSLTNQEFINRNNNETTASISDNDCDMNNTTFIANAEDVDDDNSDSQHNHSCCRSNHIRSKTKDLEQHQQEHLCKESSLGDKNCFHQESNTTKTISTLDSSESIGNPSCILSTQTRKAVNPSKSVHILTPTKSEQILFDPKLSAQDSFFWPSSSPSPSSSIASSSTPSFASEYGLNDRVQIKKDQPKETSMDHRSIYCACTSEHVKPFRFCGNCHKPIADNGVDDAPVLDGQRSLGTVEMLNSSEPLIEAEASYVDYKYENPNGYLIHATNPTIYVPKYPIEHYSIVEDVEDSYRQDEDRPLFCHECSTWFGSLDPSYPFTCKCNQAKSNTLNTNDSGSVYSVHMQKDFRYYFQHPYSRLFVAYFVIFCNFLMYAEDPLSHSLKECSIPVLGNVITFLFAKYPTNQRWQLIKATMALLAILFGALFGKYILHRLILKQIFRLKMFRDESGTWMVMLISTFLSCYLASQIYNTILLCFHPEPARYFITSNMGISYASFMKIAACGTWCGDFFTAWMITDMMLQDNLYPNWCPKFRAFWHQHTNIRIVVFWTGAIAIAVTVIAIILSEAICWDCLTQGLLSTSEFSRAFLASSILVMDLLIVMQDWDFPHFVCDLNIKLPGLLQPSYTLEFFHKSLKFPTVDIKITGKWFNYGIIMFVMMLDLNMWKNQVIYYPTDYGQYIDVETNRVWSVTDRQSIEMDIEWTFENRSRTINIATNRPYIEDDQMIYSRFVGYPWIYKATSLIPIMAGFIFFLLLIYFYGRFPPKTDASLGGRLPKRSYKRCRSSWRRERRDDGSATVDKNGRRGRFKVGRSGLSWATLYNKNSKSFADRDTLNQKNIPKLTLPISPTSQTVSFPRLWCFAWPISDLIVNTNVDQCQCTMEKPGSKPIKMIDQSENHFQIQTT